MARNPPLQAPRLRGPSCFPQYDIDDEFNAIHMALYQDPQMDYHEIDATEKAIRMRAAAVAYDSAKHAPEGCLWCPVLQEYVKIPLMRAVELVPQALDRSLVRYVFGEGAGFRIDKPENYIVVHKDVAQALDNYDLSLIPADPAEPRITRWKIAFVNKIAENRPVSGQLTYGKLHGRELAWQNEHRPSSRYLYYHFILSIIINFQHRRTRDSQEDCARLVQAAAESVAWGSWVRRLVLLSLAQQVGLVPTELRLLLSDTKSLSETCMHMEHALLPHEEAEIAKRLLKATSVKYGMDLIKSDTGKSRVDSEDEDELDDDYDNGAMDQA